MTNVTLTKECSACKKILSAEHFHANKTRKSGLASQCKDCFKETSRRHYERNKQAYFDRNQEVRRRQKERILEMKRNRPCTDCGHSFHPFIMEFDHLDPSTKKFSLGRSGQISNKTLEVELSKCDLVCANCHKMRTFRRKQRDPRHVLSHID